MSYSTCSQCGTEWKGDMPCPVCHPRTIQAEPARRVEPIVEEYVPDEVDLEPILIEIDGMKESLVELVDIIMEMAKKMEAPVVIREVVKEKTPVEDELDFDLEMPTESVRLDEEHLQRILDNQGDLATLLHCLYTEVTEKKPPQFAKKWDDIPPIQKKKKKKLSKLDVLVGVVALIALVLLVSSLTGVI